MVVKVKKYRSNIMVHLYPAHRCPTVKSGCWLGLGSINTRAGRESSLSNRGFKTLSFIFVFCLGLLTSCSFAPKYQTPQIPVATHFKEAGHWVLARPSIEVGKKSRWWRMFHDKTLNRLEEKVSCDNNNLKIAYARYQEALQIARVARSALYPTILGIANANRAQNSKTLINTPASYKLLYDSFLWSGFINYEVDLWGKIRNTVVANDSMARASQFDVVAASLSLHAELAGDYFTLRSVDDAQRVLDKTVVTYRHALTLVKARHVGGLVPEADVAQAETLYQNAKTMATENKLRRAQLEHAIAILTGQVPANFSIKPRHHAFHLVTISPELPSTLLERRPDVAAAELRVKSANAAIGVARAAFFPTFNLFATVGGQSSHLPDLFSAKSLFWAVGPTAGTTIVSLVQPMTTWVLFDGFKLQAMLGKAKAGVHEAAAAYRQTVLTAVKEVEDNLISIHRLDQEIQTQSASLHAEKRALAQANYRWRGGIATYIDVAPIEYKVLQSNITLFSLRTRRQLASVELVKALGGGWHCKSRYMHH